MISFSRWIAPKAQFGFSLAFPQLSFSEKPNTGSQKEGQKLFRPSILLLPKTETKTNIPANQRRKAHYIRKLYTFSFIRHSNYSPALINYSFQKCNGFPLRINRSCEILLPSDHFWYCACIYTSRTLTRRVNSRFCSRLH